MFNKNRQILNILFEAIPEGVIIVDKNQEIVAANNALEKMFGYTKDELSKKSLKILIPKKFHDNHNIHFKNFINSRKSRKIKSDLNLIGISKTGKKFPVEIGLNHFEIGKNIFVFALIIDVSVRKANEKKIHSLKNELEKKVLKRTADLHNTITQLKELNLNFKKEIKKRIAVEDDLKNALQKEIELNELKSKFLTMVSHEFKNPLSGILTSSMLLNKYQLTEQQTNREKHIKIIANKTHYLNTILNDFLSMEKLDLNNIKYKHTKFNLSTVINEVVYNINMILKEGQRIYIPNNIDEFKINQDEKYLKLILSNILNNAVKYSPEFSNIYIEIAENNSKIEIKVIDSGIGIPEKDQKFIFNRYFRAENALNIPGTGIGLNIVSTHLNNLGGTMNFSSKINQGTTFVLEFPNNKNYENHTID